MTPVLHPNPWNTLTHVTSSDGRPEARLVVSGFGEEAMSTERVSGPVTSSTQRQSDWLVPRGTLKRKFHSLLQPTRQGEICYPSPPMSSPPSPPGPPPELPVSAVSEPTTYVPASTVAAASFGQSLYVPPPPPPPPPFARPPPPLGHVPFPPTFSGQPPRPVGIPSPALGVFQAGRSATSGPVVTVGPSSGSSSSTRTGRKSKAHVASACVNCKRAHLSCDVQRPCARCVASGKQVGSQQ